MKSTLVTIAGIAAISYAVPSSYEELCALISTDEEKAKVIALNAANQYFQQINLINVRNKIAESLSVTYEVKPKLFIGKTEVVATVDGEGTINGYKAVEGKKVYKKDEKVGKESAKDFIERVVKEKELDEATIKAIVQSVANANPFTAKQKRVRGSVASKHVGAKWTKLAEKIIAAGNGQAAATKLSKQLGETVDISGEDATKRLALALSNQAKKALAAVTASQGEFAGTDEQTLVVGGGEEKTV